MKLSTISHGRFFWIPPLLCLLAVTFLIYGNTLQHQFVYDDQFFTSRTDIRSFAGLVNIWLHPFYAPLPTVMMTRPFTLMTFALNYILFGTSPLSFHITNILINGGVAFLIYLILCKIYQKQSFALLAALLFTIAPIHVEAVAFTKARDELLSTFFVYLSWLSFLSYTNHPKKKQLFVLFLCGLTYFFAVTSKELIFFVPAIFFLFDWVQHRRSITWYIPPLVAYGISAGLYGLFLLQATGTADFTYAQNIPFYINPLRTTSFFIQKITAFRLVLLSFEKTLLPFHLSASYHYNQISLDLTVSALFQALAGIGILLGCFFLFLWKKTKTTPLALGALIFFVSSLVTAKIFFSEQGEFFVERWQYSTSLGPILILAYGLSFLMKRHAKVGILVLVVVTSLYEMRTFTRNPIWNNEETLYTSMIQDAPESVQGYKSLSELYTLQKKYDKAFPLAEKTNTLYPNNAEILNTLGVIFTNQQKYSDAEAYLTKALNLDPGQVYPHLNLINLFAKQRRWNDIIVLSDPYVHSVRRLPPFLVYWYSVSLMMEEKPQESHSILQRTGMDKSKDTNIELLIAVDIYKTSTAEGILLLRSHNVTPQTAISRITTMDKQH